MFINTSSLLSNHFSKINDPLTNWPRVKAAPMLLTSIAAGVELAGRTVLSTAIQVGILPLKTLLGALKTAGCAAGIIILPLVASVSPTTSYNLAEKLGLIDNDYASSGILTKHLCWINKLSENSPVKSRVLFFTVVFSAAIGTVEIAAKAIAWDVQHVALLSYSAIKGILKTALCLTTIPAILTIISPKEGYSEAVNSGLIIDELKQKLGNPVKELEEPLPGAIYSGSAKPQTKYESVPYGYRLLGFSDAQIRP